MSKKRILLALLVLAILVCGGLVTYVVIGIRSPLVLDAAWVAEQAEKYLASRDDIEPEIRERILAGKVVEGMSPDEAVAAGGPFRYLIEERGSLAASMADIRYYFEYERSKPAQPRMPPDVLWMQRSTPSDVSIQLAFRNVTQFDTVDPVIFVVHFEAGRATLIEQQAAVD